MSFPTSVPVEMLQSPQKLYDFLMGHLEPELVSENLPHLDEPYTGESAEERANRYARYSDACSTLGKIVEALHSSLRTQTPRIAKAIDAAALAADTAERDRALADLSDAISAA